MAAAATFTNTPQVDFQPPLYCGGRSRDEPWDFSACACQWCLA
jgi:hypothetical protein